MRQAFRRLFLVFTMGTALCLFHWVAPQKAVAAQPDLVIFAAASTTDAVNALTALYDIQGKGKVSASFASSSTLAKQIEQGAPAAVFLSANIKWMDYLEEKGLLAGGSRKNLLRNRIALVVPASSPARAFKLTEQTDLTALLGKDGRLAVGDPAHVPVGMYGKQALEKLGLWEQVKDRLAPTKDVRAGLALVEQGEASLGLVYESDAAASPKVRLISVFPEDSHPEVVYPVAAVAGKQEEAARNFIDFLSTPEAIAIFKQYGFEGI
ncbi:molybdate ABC transporter substrate-binding protein [Desulfovibrio sp. OttesenSCG-928-F20]|nr:molybdate ABC transporter substrate-binding protein [Desulfovibrio sp. OttesenSCG-928-F20]